MEGIQEWDLNCTFVEAALGVIFFSRKFKHFSSLSTSIVNWICFSYLFKFFWNSQYCSLDLDHAWVSFKLNSHIRKFSVKVYEFS